MEDLPTSRGPTSAGARPLSHDELTLGDGGATATKAWKDDGSRTERVTQTVRLAKGSVGFGMNIDNRGVVVSVIAGSPASVRHPDHSWPRPPACLTPFEPPHPPAGLMSFASRTTACHR